MKSKISKIERNRLRWDYLFSRFVTVFGLLVLATFLGLILHIFGNAMPLLQSPDIDFTYSVNIHNKDNEVDLGSLQLQEEWFSLHYANCAIRIVALSKPKTSGNALGVQQSMLTKKYAADCNKHPIGLLGSNNQYLGMISNAGLLEVFLIDSRIVGNQTNISLDLQYSVNLPNELVADIEQYFGDNPTPNLHDWLVKWRMDYNGETIALTRSIDISESNSTEPTSLFSVNHQLLGIEPISAKPVPNAFILLPIINRQSWLTVTNEDLRQLQLLNLSLQPQQTLLLPDNIVHIGVSTNLLDVFVLTENQQLHKYFLVNNEGRFLLQAAFVTQLLDIESVQETQALIPTAQTNKALKPNIGMVFDNAHNMLIVIQQNGLASIINSVTGEIANQVELPLNTNIAYAREQLILRHSDRYAVYQVNHLQGITSWQTLFGKNHYSAYPAPAYVWQTSAATDMQSPKFSIVPLLMGSLKASLLALVVALPLALGGAIYTAYFAKPQLRNVIKPTIEMLEAIPSVIIGFIAAVWIAPFAEQYLVSIFLVFILMPFVVIVIAAIHGLIQPKIAHTKLANWGLLINTILLLIALMFIFLLSLLIIDWSIANDMNGSLEMVTGLTLSKTAIVVSLALGVAIAPTIYTLIDDALFEVPDGVKQAAFALGATPVQTLTKVVLVVALPSIIAAIMLGFGRAFGETMIILMVTGNTPIANWDLFSGLRTLTSNLAIELQEAQLESTLYYILFLTAAILFLFTFAVNTVAALLKRRMRRDN